MDYLERRTRQRFSLSAKCTLQVGCFSGVVALVKNMSRTGMLVECGHFVAVERASEGDCLQVDVEMLAAERTPKAVLRCSCVVVWTAVELGAVVLGLAISKMSIASAAGESTPVASVCDLRDMVM